MIYPAIDVRGGRAVQLVGGRPEAERIALPDPVAVARRWIDAGFQALHVVDLDAALGSGDNRAVIRELMSSTDVPVNVGGGVRDDARLAEWLEAGAAHVIVGTRAIEDPAWRSAVARRYPERVILAADLLDETIVVHGWQERSGFDATGLLASLADEPLAAVLVTDVGREGRLGGVDIEKFTRLAAAAPHPLIAAGGVRDLDDLHALKTAGLAGVVLGMALYTGAIDAGAAARVATAEVA